MHEELPDCLTKCVHVTIQYKETIWRTKKLLNLCKLFAYLHKIVITRKVKANNCDQSFFPSSDPALDPALKGLKISKLSHIHPYPPGKIFIPTSCPIYEKPLTLECEECLKEKSKN